MPFSSVASSFYLVTTLFISRGGDAFLVVPPTAKCYRASSLPSKIQNELEVEDNTSSYDDSGASSKGIVSSLTNLVNFFMNDPEAVERTRNSLEAPQPTPPPPSSPQELMEKIAEDYTVNNYLWTGKIHLPAFEEDCKFTDPTLSFEGRDKFVSNVQNLQPIVNFLVRKNEQTNAGEVENDDRVDSCRSVLLDIQLKDEYVQSRWNMVGDFDALPWKPRIDVIGRTKFWFRKVAQDDNDNTPGYRVYFYDECWEMPAGKALLQIITPAGTISNQ